MPNGIREIDEQRWSNIEQAFYDKDNEVLIKCLLSLDLFPIKDSYAAFQKLDTFLSLQSIIKKAPTVPVHITTHLNGGKLDLPSALKC